MKKQNPRYTSIDFTYEIFGRAAFVEAINVVIVSTVVMPEKSFKLSSGHHLFIIHAVIVVIVVVIIVVITICQMVVVRLAKKKCFC